jgi:hypothetical protein
MNSLLSVDDLLTQKGRPPMAISIPSSLAASSSIASTSPSTPAPTQTTPSVPAAADTVKLSQDAQVHLLKQQGQSLSQIASNLSIPIATVDGYLGITVPTTQQPAQVQSNSAETTATPTAPVQS